MVSALYGTTIDKFSFSGQSLLRVQGNGRIRWAVSLMFLVGFVFVGVLQRPTFHDEMLNHGAPAERAASSQRRSLNGCESPPLEETESWNEESTLLQWHTPTRTGGRLDPAHLTAIAAVCSFSISGRNLAVCLAPKPGNPLPTAPARSLLASKGLVNG